MFEATTHPNPGARIQESRTTTAPPHPSVSLSVWRALAIGVLLSATLAGASFALETDLAAGASRFSPRGFKGAIGVGSLEPSESQRLDQGPVSFLALGYGVDSHITFWLALIGSEHERSAAFAPADVKSDMGGLEVSLQYSFLTSERFQPYGRLGFGAYATEDRRTHDAMTGGGVRFGLGADYFFSRHFGAGVELMARSAEYTQGRMGRKGDFHDLPKDVEANAAGVMFSITVQ